MKTSESPPSDYDLGHYISPDTRILGVLLMMEIQRRLFNGNFGRIPKDLKTWTLVEGGYCLDAPEHLPAGACEFYELDPTDMEDYVNEFGHFGAPAQLTVSRE